jgi:uncharacterized protein (UPF0333 family)
VDGMFKKLYLKLTNYFNTKNNFTNNNSNNACNNNSNNVCNYNSNNPCNNAGQLSIEYLLLVLAVFLIFISITIPVLNFAIDSSMESLNIMKSKEECSKIITAIDIVYSNGIGSKRTVDIEIPKPIDLIFNGNQIYFDYLLNNGSTKRVSFNCKYTNITQSLSLSKGLNTVVVEYPIDSDKIVINTL